MGDGIVVVVELPQDLHKISNLIEAIGNIWPGTTLNVKPEGPAQELGNWYIHITADE